LQKTKAKQRFYGKTRGERHREKKRIKAERLGEADKVINSKNPVDNND